MKTSSDLGYEVVPISRYRQLGPEKTMQLIVDRIGDAPLYITFDLD
jgi:guanidinopropionase